MVTEEKPSRDNSGLAAPHPGHDAARDGGRFFVEQVSTGVHASGFGRTEESKPFAFRVYKSTMHIEIYRADLLTAVPDKSDVVAVADHSVTEIDLTDERSILAAVRDAVSSADELAPGRAESSAVRSFLARVGSLIESVQF